MMRQDQIDKLDELAEKLADVFITEADPANWSGHGKLPNEMDPQTRGDRHWDRKGAMGTGGVLKYTLDLKAAALGRQSADPEKEADNEADLDKKIRNAQKMAAEAADRVLKNAKKGAFDKHTHGRKG